MPKRSSTQPVAAIARIISSSTRLTRPKAFHCTFSPRRSSSSQNRMHLRLSGNEELVLEEKEVHARRAVQKLHFVDDVPRAAAVAFQVPHRGDRAEGARVGAAPAGHHAVAGVTLQLHAPERREGDRVEVGDPRPVGRVDDAAIAAEGDAANTREVAAAAEGGQQFRAGPLGLAAADHVDPRGPREDLLLDRLGADAAQHERAVGIALAEGPHRQHRERQQVGHAGESDHGRRVGQEVEEDAHVEGLVGADALVIAEVNLEAGVFQGPCQVERPQRDVQLALHLLAVAHEEHVQVDQGDVGRHAMLLTAIGGAFHSAGIYHLGRSGRLPPTTGGPAPSSPAGPPSPTCRPAAAARASPAGDPVGRQASVAQAAEWGYPGGCRRRRAVAAAARRRKREVDPAGCPSSVSAAGPAAGCPRPAAAADRSPASPRPARPAWPPRPGRGTLGGAAGGRWFGR